jgi:hypothetical protein
MTNEGLNFADTQTNVGGMTSELLDHYEEGTWTPTYSGGNVTSIPFAVYAKIGGVVQFQAAVAWNSGGGGNSYAGLPFTASAQYSMTVVPYADSGIPAPPSGKGWVIGYVLNNGTAINFFWEPTTTGVTMATTGALYFEGSYRAA